ncbi:MAG: EMC3/TMCO1 family protein [Candidatus Kariarchaeaceae archaeon]
MTLLDDIKNWVSDSVHEYNLHDPPYSIVFLVIVSITISTLSALVTKKTVDLDAANKNFKEIQEFNRQKKTAMETADRKLWIQVQRKQEYIQGLQLETMLKRMRPMLFTMIPFILIFSTLRGVMGGDTAGELAILPFKININIPLIGKVPIDVCGDNGSTKVPGHQDWTSNNSAAGFSFMYFLSAVSIGSLVQRFLGVSTQNKT